jgi:hypothetical protein
LVQRYDSEYYCVPSFASQIDGLVALVTPDEELDPFALIHSLDLPKDKLFKENNFGGEW